MKLLKIVEILRQGTDIREIVEFEPSYGQNAVFYLGKADADNFFKGDGWIDDPSWTAASPLNLEMPIHEFKVLANVKITAPNSDKIKFSPSSVGIDAWVNKTGADMTAAEREIFIPAGTLVKIYGYISTAGAFQLDWKVERVDDGAYYVVTVDNMGKRASFVAEQNFITGVNDALGLTRVVGDGVLDISRVESAGIVDTKANTTVLAQTNPGHTEHDLGYKCDRLLTLDKNKELTYYYVTQTGFGYSLGTVKMAKIRPDEGQPTTEKDWGYYIPSGNATFDNKYTTQIGNEVVFMIGKAEGLEITNYVIGSTITDVIWNNWTTGRYSWATRLENCTNSDNTPGTENPIVH